MRTALLIIPAITAAVDRRKYLIACFDVVMKEGYMPFCPDLYENFVKMNQTKFIKITLPLSEVVFLFEDFGTGERLIDLIEAIDKEKPIYKKTLSGESEKYHNNLESILNDVSDRMKIPMDELQGKTRKREVVDARFVFYRRAKRCTKASLSRIGMAVGKHHATVLHGIREAENTRQVVDLYKRLYG